MKIVSRCSLSPDTAGQFLSSLFDNTSNDSGKPGATSQSKYEFQELEIDKFHVISNWYHFAILSLGTIKNNRANAEWIAGRLGITKKQAREAFDRLLRLGLVKKKRKGFLQCSKPLWVSTDSTSRAIKKYHHDYLSKAQDALNEDGAMMELFSSVTMVTDETKLATARQMIKKFRDRLCKLLESGEGQRVFTLAVQLFPVSKIGGYNGGKNI